MKISTKFILFVILIHLTILVLSFQIFKENKLLFIFSEVFILLSIFLSIRLYKDFIQPLKYIATGVDAIRDKDFNVKFLKTGSLEVDQLIAVYNDMIDELRAERTQQVEQHFFLEKLIQTSPVGIIILDFDNQITSLNPEAIKLLDLDNNVIIGQSLEAIAHPIATTLMKLKTGDTVTFKSNGIRTFKCYKTHFVDRGFKHHFLTIEELTSEILQAEKKAYGKVIRMMAHEVNNSIGAVNSFLDSLLNYKDQINKTAQEDYQTALEISMDRNERLNRFMKKFAEVIRLPEPHKELYDLQKLIQDIFRLLRPAAAKQKIELDLLSNGHAMMVNIDVSQIEQVLINAVKNAMESIGQEGKISLILEENPSTLIIRDNGPGIPDDLAPQLFSPFYSTKKDGQGIGLTLSKEILLNHGFLFSLETIEPLRTEFRIDFTKEEI